MPIHFNAAMEPDNWCDKPLAVFGFPLFVLAVHILCIAMTCLEKTSSKVSKKVLSAVVWITPLCSNFGGAIMYWNTLSKVSGTLSENVFFMALPETFIAILFIILGNYMPKCRQNRVIGIKTSLTLSDEDNWNSTHRFCGKLWVIMGIILLACGFLPLKLKFISLIILLSGIIAPIIYSENYHRKKEKQSE